MEEASSRMERQSRSRGKRGDQAGVSEPSLRLSRCWILRLRGGALGVKGEATQSLEEQSSYRGSECSVGLWGQARRGEVL